MTKDGNSRDKSNADITNSTNMRPDD